MPNRIIREGILSSESKSSRWIPTSIRRKLKNMPCVICGIDFDIQCDHIVSVAMGGLSTEENLQPLCRDCNYTKKHLRSNEETLLVIKSRGIAHFQKAAYRWWTRKYNSYDKPSMLEFASACPEQMRDAQTKFESFIDGDKP